MNRRDLMVVAGACAAFPAAATGSRAQPAPSGEPVLSEVSFSVNGQRHQLELDTRTTLLDALREHAASLRTRLDALLVRCWSTGSGSIPV